MCINCLSPEERAKIIRYCKLPETVEWIHLWSLEKNRQKTREEIIQEFQACISPDDFDLVLGEGERVELFGVDLKYYAIAVATEGGVGHGKDHYLQRL